jgi:hypothetical protein
MKKLEYGYYEGERALYNSHGLHLVEATFANGESPLKESSDILLEGGIFKWKYPLWYCKNIKVEGTTLLDTARSGIWYTDNIEMKNCVIEAPKTFRRASNITLVNCQLPNAQETFWNCKNISLTDVVAKGDYFALNSENIKCENFVLDGNYAFDGAKNIEVRNAKMLSKDSFWNTENVTVYDSLIIGEYLGWNSKNLTFVNCTIDSNQGMCYMENVKMVNCKLLNTDLCFELSTVDAEITSPIISVKNPISGKIHAKSIGEIILDKDMIDPDKTEITVDEDSVIC